jgi:hypothetical protein
MNTDRSGRRTFSADATAILLIGLSLAIHAWWMQYTRYVEEDAFITFRFAEQILKGNGFVYNAGERVYGTTTPLFTLLLSLWVALFSNDMILGARMLNLLAAAAVPAFTWGSLKLLNRSAAERCLVPSALLLSSKLVHMNTNGMETSLSLALMAASWYTWVGGRMKLTGLLCGLLLWTRIDNLFWLAVLGIGTAIRNPAKAAELGLAGGITYLPWVVFAILFFGSPIPHTATAKWVAYVHPNQAPYWSHLETILKYLSPSEDPARLQLAGGLAVLGIACFGICRKGMLRERAFLILILFTAVEILRLTLTRTTFFDRYFIPLLWTTMIIFGIGLAALWEGIQAASKARAVFLSLLLSQALFLAWTGRLLAQDLRNTQSYRHEASLKALGMWLKHKAPPQSTVLLEPLGYAGYYSGQIMIDEVGLVTPSVTDLKRRGIGPEAYAAIFKPDFVVVHCDDRQRIPRDEAAGPEYVLAETFDPLGYQPERRGSWWLAWAACYQLWRNGGR